MSKPLFIVCGLLTAAGGGLYGWARSTNDVTLGRTSGVKSFESQVGTLKGMQGQQLQQGLIDANNKQIAAYDQEIKRIKEWFGERRGNLRAWFNNNPTPEPANFKVSYLNQIKRLSKRYIQEAHASDQTDASGISKTLPQFLGKWGTGAPPQEDLPHAQQEFNVLEALLDSLNIRDAKNKPLIYNLIEIKVAKQAAAPRNNPRGPRGPRRPGPRNDQPTGSPFYDKRMVDITLEIPTSGVNQLLNSLLTNEVLLFSVDSFTAEKTAGAKIPGRKPLKNGLKVTLKVAVLDFKESVVKTK